jgi:GH25 family lysozyme M1 (1,4-beta-N-acetylmuramidase)
MADTVGVQTSNGSAPPHQRAPAVPATRATRGGTPDAATVVRTFRVVTANVQSFPRNALTLDQAREDLRANAADGDLVLLQEIDQRYRRLVLDEFPADTWHVYFGPRGNHSPVAARKDVFDVLDRQALMVHPGVPKVHERRYLTHLHLRHRETGVHLHATNIHLVSGAFHRPPRPDAAMRQAEWHDGMRKHDDLIRSLIATGAPVIAGGDYNRQLRAFRSQLRALVGRPVSFGVDTASIDLLWFIDGTDATWTERGRTTFRGREGRPPKKRNSDHAARQVTVALTTSLAPSPVLIAPDGSTTKISRKKERKMQKKVASFAPRPPAVRPASAAEAPNPPTGSAFSGPADEPFALTVFGDVNPKRVDWKTRAALEEVERRLGYPLTVVQGSYNNGKVSASAGTHDAGGVVDLLAWDWRRKVAALRDVGFAAWHRPAVAGLWGAHIHAVLVDHGRLAPGAASQVVAYRAGRDGLKGNRVDGFPRPTPVPVFSYPPAPAGPLPGASTAAGSVAPLGRAFPPHRTLDGVDISHHQSGRVDLRAARAAGLRWMYVKATEGTSVEDKMHRRRVREARAAGLPVGAYHFARPEGRDAVAEARYFLAHIEPRAGDMVPMLDLEDTGELSLGELTTWTGEWVRTVTLALRRKGLTGRPIIYTPFNLEKGFGCLLWVARYSNDFRPPVIPRPWRRAAIWQHSNGSIGPVKNVPGLGRVDVNALHPDLPLSALRLRSARRPAERGRSSPVPSSVPPPAPPHAVVPEPPTVTELGAVQPVEPAAIVVPLPPSASTPATPPVVSTPTVTTPTVTTPTVTTPTVTTPSGTTATVTTAEHPAGPGEPGSILITVTVPVPPLPAPVVVFPDLGPLEEQLTLAARSLQGAIDALPERPEP